MHALLLCKTYLQMLDAMGAPPSNRLVFAQLSSAQLNSHYTFDKARPNHRSIDHRHYRNKMKYESASSRSLFSSLLWFALLMLLDAELSGLESSAA